MIEVVFNGQVGNNLFQYFLGRCIAKEKNYRISYKVMGNESNIVKFDDEFLIFSGIKLPKKIEGKEIHDNHRTFNDHIFNYSDIEGDGKIILDGYFQNYLFYKKYKNFIKNEIYNYNNLFDTNFKPNPEDIVLHLRLNNYPWKININFYERILQKEIYKKIWLVTDQPNHSDIFYLKNKFDCDVISSNPQNDFIFLINSNKIVMSQSTYCWWASLLSKAETIYYPIVKNKNDSGIWFLEPWLNIDLFVDDEIRYKKIII